LRTGGAGSSGKAKVISTAKKGSGGGGLESTPQLLSNWMKFHKQKERARSNDLQALEEDNKS
jgi:hypothetical protein